MESDRETVARSGSEDSALEEIAERDALPVERRQLSVSHGPFSWFSRQLSEWW